MDSKHHDKNRAPPKADAIQRLTGSFGRYQLFLCFIIFLSKFPIAFNQMAIIFLAPKTTFTCPDSTKLCPCSNPVYNKAIFSSTIISKWDLICSQRWLVSFSQTLFQLGTLIGSIIFGMASDRFGRKKPFVIAIIIQTVMGVSAAYAKSYWVFTFLRFAVGLSVGGTMVIGFVIIMEFVGSEYRDVVSALYQVPFNLGHMLLPLFGYYIRDYSIFQLAISIPTIILFSYIWLVPETPRWLIAVQKTQAAIAVLQLVAKVNKRGTENIKVEIEAFQHSIERNTLKKGTVLDLFRTPNLRKHIICISMNWLSCSYCFYGISQYVGQLSGDIFINVAASGSVALLGTLLSIPLMRFIGRKTIVIICNFMCAGVLFVLLAVPEGVWSVVCACVGVVSSFIIFVLVYLYSTELFPTVVRNAALGFSSMIARVGSMIAPFVVESKEVASWMPPVWFAIVPLIAGSVTFLLLETKGCELMTTIEEGEAFGRKHYDTPRKQ